MHLHSKKVGYAARRLLEADVEVEEDRLTFRFRAAV